MFKLAWLKRSVPDRRSRVHAVRPLATKCRGQPIPQSQIFEYTNGRFLTDEAAQLDKRRLIFDLNKLCERAASVGPSTSPIRAVDKYEGGYSKALILQKEDGTELVAKLPLTLAGPAAYTTASEVATLEYVRTYTDVPTPKVYAWSADKSNPAGSEYILMEKAKGVQLFTVWDTMKDAERLQLIKNLVKWESQLMSLRFPAFGSLYLRETVTTSDTYIPLDQEMDPQGRFCVGPSCQTTWQSQLSHSLPGPWQSIGDLGVHLAQKGIRQLSYGPNFALPHVLRGFPRDHLALLQQSIEVIHILNTRAASQGQTRPVLSHTDLHMGNIYVSQDDPSVVHCIIDWQMTQISPMCLQARWPVFLKPPRDYQTGLIRPKLPDAYEHMTLQEKEVAQDDLRQANAAKAYEIRTRMDNLDAYTALIQPVVWRKLLTHCADTWKEGPAPLYEFSLSLAAVWRDLGLTEACPFHSDSKSHERHAAQLAGHEERDRIHTIAREALETDADGWIAPDLNFSDKVEQNNELFEACCESLSDHKSVEEVRQIWPFPDTLRA